MKQIIVLAMHGAPPSDFPQEEMAEFFGLYSRLEHGGGPQRHALEKRCDELHAKMRAWPRTPQNDRFWAASLALSQHLSQAAACEVVVGFNEFCAPSLDEALDQTVTRGADRVVVVTPMMTRGGEHAETEIPAAVRRALERHPHVQMHYAWPFETPDVAQFLAAQVKKVALGSEDGQ